MESHGVGKISAAQTSRILYNLVQRSRAWKINIHIVHEIGECWTFSLEPKHKAATIFIHVILGIFVIRNINIGILSGNRWNARRIYDILHASIMKGSLYSLIYASAIRLTTIDAYSSDIHARRSFATRYQTWNSYFSIETQCRCAERIQKFQKSWKG